MQNNQEIFADNATPFNTIKLISAGWDGCVKKHVVEIAAQKVSKESQLSAQSTKQVTIVKQQYWITSMTMSNDTHTLFVANSIFITQFQKEESTLNYYPVRTLKGHYAHINFISLSNSKMHLLSASWDKTLRVWDLENGTQLACLNVEQKEHQSPINSCCWNGQDTLFASGDNYGGVVVWSSPLSIYNTSNQFIPLCKFEAELDKSNISCLKFQENGLDLFASYDGNDFSSGVIRLWSINKKVLKKGNSKNATLPLIREPKLQSKKMNGNIGLFDVRGSMIVVGVNEEILSLSADSLQSVADAMKFEKVHKIKSLVFSKDGKYVASGSYDKSIAIFDSKSGKCIKLIKGVQFYLISGIVFEI